jgi:hypothetical protein
MLLYTGAALSGLSSVVVLFLGSRVGPDKHERVTLMGLRAPLGAFVAGWGALSLLAAGPFDAWWHDAYGLDVKILSPPHTLVILGVAAIDLAALFLILRSRNRADGVLRRSLENLAIGISGLMVAGMFSVVLKEYTYRSDTHRARFYVLVALAAPPLFISLATAFKRRWTCTTIAAVYSAVVLLQLWLLPIVPATPRLGPVYQTVTHFIPPEFPLLLIVPAFACDLLLRWRERAAVGVRSVVVGAAFLLVFMAVQWPFGEFLMSEAARNRTFGAHLLAYSVPPWSDAALHRFSVDPTGTFWLRLALALLAAIAMTRAAIAWGGWMQRLRR